MEESEMEEERRLAYVGITRAEYQLFLTNAQMRTLFGRTSANPQSRFIKEIPEELLEGYEPAKRTTTSTSSPFQSFNRQPQRPAVTRPNVATASTTGGDEIAWKVGDKAEHKVWGIGTVVSVKGAGEGTEVDIAFPSPVGIKRLLAKFAPIKKV
jgi:DNA helicase-2/ATP-dependent DNA helicase PcrA